jgi:hypothetical protein
VSPGACVEMHLRPLPTRRRQAVREIVARGYPTLGPDRYPDGGGSHEGMLEATAARDALLVLVATA